MAARLEVWYIFTSNLSVCKMPIQLNHQYDRTEALRPWPRGSKQTGSRVALKRKEGSINNGVAILHRNLIPNRDHLRRRFQEASDDGIGHARDDGPITLPRSRWRRGDEA